jgi:hypothetical protein
MTALAVVAFIIVLVVAVASRLPYFRGMKFKEVSWRWTAINLFFTWHGGRNPVSGHRFLYIGVGPFLGFDFYWPEERKAT